MNNALREIQNLIDSIQTQEELHEVYEMFKGRWDELARRKVRSFSKGDRVQFTTRSGATITGTVDKVNKKSVGVIEDGGEDKPEWARKSWRVGPSILTKID